MGDTSSIRGQIHCIRPGRSWRTASGAPQPRPSPDDAAGPWSPWRYLREHHPQVEVYEAELPPGYLGCVDHQAHTIWLDSRLLRREQRATLAHELGHLELDMFVRGTWVSASEYRVDQWAARHLIPMTDLLHAFRWSNNLDEMAEELWVDRHTLGVRLRCLSDEEQDQVMKAIERKWQAA